jgi:hypothetical protein
MLLDELLADAYRSGGTAAVFRRAGGEAADLLVTAVRLRP